MDTTPISKDELLDLVRASSDRLDSVVSTISDGRLTAPGATGDHSIKDLLAHLTAWEERLLRWIARWRETGDPQRPEPGRTWGEIDAINDRDFVASSATTLAGVLTASRRAHARVMAELESLKAADLAEPSAAWDGLALAWIVRANTADHYREHLAQIQEEQ